ncbi:hypothetical protein [Methyloterricola oryzae]|uniref:hypothetical protein n=1 Tax=Methyloterricola oryzae TaxID=1495050 RepID=UPI000AAF7423|nr:hypothetical protein [Methyloterricola oryzae]
MSLLEDYAAIAGNDVVDHLQQLASLLSNRKVVHINSTRIGGGVAEILSKLVPLSKALGLDVQWEVITGEGMFFDCTKAMHNALQGSRASIHPRLLALYEDTNAANAERLRDLLNEADFVIVHDPQPAPLIRHFPSRRGKWIWRCHIDASRPFRPVWKYLHRHVSIVSVR